jgi:cell division septation protein DedD
MNVKNVIQTVFCFGICVASVFFANSIRASSITCFIGMPLDCAIKKDKGVLRSMFKKIAAVLAVSIFTISGIIAASVSGETRLNVLPTPTPESTPKPKKEKSPKPTPKETATPAPSPETSPSPSPTM